MFQNLVIDLKNLLKYGFFPQNQEQKEVTWFNVRGFTES